MPEHVYTGPDERVYTAYLAVAPDGTVSTLIGVPGGPPVQVRRAAGNSALPEIPADGLWVAADQTEGAPPAESAADNKPAKTTKGATS